MVETFFAYLLSLLAAFTLAAFLAVSAKALLVILLIYLFRSAVFRNLSAWINPTTFISSILSGYLAMSFAAVVFSWFSLQVNKDYLFLLLLCYLWMFWQNHRKQKLTLEAGEDPSARIFAHFNSNLNLEIKDGKSQGTEETSYTIIGEDGKEEEVKVEQEEEEKPELDMQKQLMQNLQGKQVIILMGKLTGAILWGASLF